MRKLLKRIVWLGCLAGIVAAVWLYRYWSNDEYVRGRVQAMLEQRCPAADVQLRAARRNADGTISLLGLRYWQNLQGGNVELDVPEITLKLTANGHEPEVASIDLWRPRVRLVVGVDEFWKGESAWLDKFTSDLPVLRVHKGTLELVQRTPATEQARWSANATPGITGDPSSPSSRVRGDTTPEDTDRPLIVLRNVDLQIGPHSDRSLRVAANARSDIFERADLAARLDPETKSWAVSADVRGVQFGPALRELIARYAPSAAPSQGPSATGPESNSVIRPVAGRASAPSSPLGPLGPDGWALDGRGRIRVTVQRTATDQPLFHQVAVKVENASLAGPLLPFPLHGIDAVVACRGGVAQVLEFHGHNGTTTVSARGRVPLPGVDVNAAAATTTVHIEAENLELDDRLRSRLPARWQHQWDRYRPAGTVRLALDLMRRGHETLSRANVECLDASFSFDKFPYRLEHVTGTLGQQGPDLLVDLTAPAGAGTVHVSGTIAHPGPSATVNLDIDADRVPLDEEKLLSALMVPAPRARELLVKLRARGTAAVHWRVYRDDPGLPYDHSARVLVKGCSIEWNGYPVDRIEGSIQLKNGTWQSTDLHGRNDEGLIGASGTLGPRRDGFPLQLVLSGEDVELERELRDTLAPRWKELWDRMAIEGRSNIEVRLAGRDGRLPELQQLHIVPRDVSFLPGGFAYRLDGLRCRDDGGIWIRRERGNGEPASVRPAARSAWDIDFEGLEAHHGPSRWGGSGRLRWDRPGKGTLTFKQLAVDQVVFDEQLLAILPRDLAQMCRRIDPSAGALHLRQPGGEANSDAALVLQWSDLPEPSRRADWNLVMLCSGSALDVAGGLSDLSGAVNLHGQYRDGTIKCGGEIALQTCIWHDLQFTNLSGPIEVSKTQPGAAQTRIVVGNWSGGTTAPRRRAEAAPDPALEPPRQLTADLLGGKVIGTIIVLAGRNSSYGLRARLDHGRLEQYAAQVLPGRTRLSGELTSGWSLQSSAIPNGTVGWGYIVAEEGNLYELPLVFDLLRTAWDILNLKRPESPIVHRGGVELEFGPSGVVLRRMELVGETITFRGRGTMDALSATSPIDLRFYPAIGNDRRRVPILDDVLHQAGKQLVEFRVRGTLRNPAVKTRPIPKVEGTIQEIGSWSNSRIHEWAERLRRMLGATE